MNINFIISKLEKHFSPSYLDVKDESNKHLGHSGYIEGSVTHIYIKIKSDKFLNKTRIDSHREINNVLKDEFSSGLHAVRIKIL